MGQRHDSPYKQRNFEYYITLTKKKEKKQQQKITKPSTNLRTSMITTKGAQHIIYMGNYPPCIIYKWWMIGIYVLKRVDSAISC